jgi:hypothetical protein
MNLYRVWCRFEPDHINAPAGRKGQWRVTLCMTSKEFKRPVAWWRSLEEISVLSTKPYRKGCIIRPHRELNRVLAARRNHD